MVSDSGDPQNESAQRKPQRSSLRERRRLETTAEISSAALDLFEDRGVDSTTVAEIAAAAGVSQRTFFRYFPTKEAAAFVEEPDYVAVLEEWAMCPEPLDNPFADLLDVLQKATVAMASDKATRRQLRLFRLEQDNPGLGVGRAGQEQVHNDRLKSALSRRSKHRYTDYEFATMVRVSRALVDSAVFEWLTRLQAGQPANLEAIFSHNREVVGLAMLGKKKPSSPQGS